MRRLLVLGTLLASAAAALRRYRARQADAELWHEATAPRVDR